MAELPAPEGIIGVDEAGRGPLAGPVAVAAVWFPAGFNSAGIRDSKALKPTKREDLARHIQSACLWSVVAVSPEEIDRRDILHASLAGMARAARRLGLADASIWVDGNHLPAGLGRQAKAIVSGDASVAQIAAASILAKTARDRWMLHFDAVYPGYGFARHFGYPTPEHLDALHRLGPCPIHRRSFRPVQQAEWQPCLALID